MWVVAVLLGVVFITRMVRAIGYENDSSYGDFHIFWNGGRNFWAHKNPYEVKGNNPPSDKINALHNPPTAVPLFAVFALAPWPMSARLWCAVNVVISLSLGLMARQVLISQDFGRYEIIRRRRLRSSRLLSSCPRECSSRWTRANSPCWNH